MLRRGNVKSMADSAEARVRMSPNGCDKFTRWTAGRTPGDQQQVGLYFIEQRALVPTSDVRGQPADSMQHVARTWYVDRVEAKQMKYSMQRRDLLKVGSLAVASIAIGARLGTSARAAAPHVDEKDATAQSLGYKHDATKVDKAKFAKYKAGEACANCQLYQGKSGGTWGPCPIFAGKEVNAKGWCSAYVKKA